MAETSIFFTPLDTEPDVVVPEALDPVEFARSHELTEVPVSRPWLADLVAVIVGIILIVGAFTLFALASSGFHPA